MLAVLVPQRPRDDLMEYLSECKVGVVWEEGGAFQVSPGRIGDLQLVEEPGKA